MWDGEELLDWLEALRLYDSVAGDTELSEDDRERLEEELRRLDARVCRVEDGMMEAMRRGVGADDVVAASRVLAIVARRVLEDSLEAERKRI